MRIVVLYLLTALAVAGCRLSTSNVTRADNSELAALFERYWNDRMRLYPIEATFYNDNRYNHLLPIDCSDGYRDSLRHFYSLYQTYISKFDRESLNSKDRLSYDIFVRDVQLYLEGLDFPDNMMPANQFYGYPVTMGILGAGSSLQPFATVQDYNNWLSRLNAFVNWTDSAVVYFRKGMQAGYTLPRPLVQRMVGMMRNMQAETPEQSLFYRPITNMPDSIAEPDRRRLAAAYRQIIGTKILPAYKKLEVFLQNEYLPAARLTDGIGALPNGSKQYEYLVRLQTTTTLQPAYIYEQGVKEVARLRQQQDSVKNAVGFKGSLAAFFEYMKTDRQFMPYTTADEVLEAFRDIHKKIAPHVSKMFSRLPKAPFEIRQTEAFRAATASAEYYPGSPDGSKPGIFYVPIVDAKTFNTTTGMESLFLHEAIPGHHYQGSLQQEDTTLPKFRRFLGNNAYAEGWALYCESLGKELGLYTDPYQYMAALGDEMHRAIRLVVDVGVHTGKMTHRQAIAYMVANEGVSEQYAANEIERYMAYPAQALGYKIGSMKIWDLRRKYQQQLGSRFNLAAFHDALLKDGAVPLDVLEKSLDNWAARQ